MDEKVKKILDYYANLIILQYHSKPKAQAHIRLLASLYLADAVMFELEDVLNIDVAIGAQLDLIGKIVGCLRGTLTDDEEYRLLIRFKILENALRGSEYNIDKGLAAIFPGEIILANNWDLTITYITKDTLTHVLEEAIKRGYLLAPCGVDLEFTVPVPDPLKIFGFNKNGIIGNAVGFSDKNKTKDGTFLSKENINIL